MAKKSIKNTKGIINIISSAINNTFHPKARIGKMFKDSDGYYKVKLSNGTLAVQDVDDNGKPINHTYIGSNTKIPKKGSSERQKK